MAIDLSSAESIPLSILARLHPFHRRLRNLQFLDELFGDPTIAGIVADLEDLCLDHGIIGYHYTRAIRKQIEVEGLRIDSGQARRRDFLRDHRHRFTAAQLREVEAQWRAYFDRRQDAARDGRIWFNVTLDALTSGGADRLLRYFGGEVIYMPLTSVPSIKAVLGGIGEPLLVSARLEAAQCTTFTDQPWGEAWLSAYHKAVNPDAHRVDWDTYVRASIGPERLISIRKATDLGWG